MKGRKMRTGVEVLREIRNRIQNSRKSGVKRPNIVLNNLEQIALVGLSVVALESEKIEKDIADNIAGELIVSNFGPLAHFLGCIFINSDGLIIAE